MNIMSGLPLTPEQRSEVHPTALEFFDTYGEAAFETYKDTTLYHATHSMFADQIKTEGLVPGREIFPAAYGEFCLRIFDTYSDGHPNDKKYLNHYVLGQNSSTEEPRGIYLSTTVSESSSYGIPERIMLLMRGMSDLRTKQALTQEERAIAAYIYDEQLERLTTGSPTIDIYAVDPIMPAILNARYSGLRLDQPLDEYFVQLIAGKPDALRYGGLEINEPISPEYMTLHRQIPVTVQTPGIKGIGTGGYWTDSIK